MKKGYDREISPADHDIPHTHGARYLYRTYVIVADSAGWSVRDPRRPDSEEDEDGWGVTLYDAMAVVNELVDGGPRRKSR